MLLLSPPWFQLASQLVKMIPLPVTTKSALQTSLEPPLRPIDEQFLLNYFNRKLGISKGDSTSEVMRAVSELLAIKAGPQLYRTLEDLCELDCFRRTQVNRKKDQLVFRQGINETIMSNVAPQRYGTEWVVNLGDGTRVVRACEPHNGYLMGVVYSPDVDCWPDEPGVPIPQHYEDLPTIIRAIRGHNALSHEVDLEVMRCITDSSRPILVHTIFPEPHSGMTGFLHWKMWIAFIQR